VSGEGPPPDLPLHPIRPGRSVAASSRACWGF
jgi:hypothetical protein